MHMSFSKPNRINLKRLSRAFHRELKRGFAFEQLESRCMLIGSDWTNGLSPLNVDNDQTVSPLDVLQVVNELNEKRISDPSTGRLPHVSIAGTSPPPFFDVDCDQFITPLDVLVIINHLNGSETQVGRAFMRSDGSSGNFSTLGCGPALREGSSFVTSLTTQMTIPTNAAALSFVLEGIEFDSSSQGGIHDAFEVALLDTSGRSLVHPIATGRDAFFNSTENGLPKGTSQVVLSDNRVTLSLADVLPGTQAALVFRLVNNDSDTRSAAAIKSVEFVTNFSSPTPVSPDTERIPSGLISSFGAPAGPRAINPVSSGLSIDSPDNGSSFDAGAQVLISGHVPIDMLSSLGNVTLDGRVVDAMDGAGNFFTRVLVRPGENAFEFTATDAQGLASNTRLTLSGKQSLAGAIDLSLLSDVSASSDGVYGRTSFDDDSDVLYTELSIRNARQYLADAPLLVGIHNISDPKVRLRDYDGVTPDGIPFYDFTRLVDGGTLLPGQSSQEKSIGFFVPNREQFTYDLMILAALNQVPRITTVPIIESVVGRAYAYDVDAVDLDDDPLTYALVSAPDGLSIDSKTGLITAIPTSLSPGTITIIVQVDDGRGGIARHRFELSTIVPPPNRPPLFTSFSVVIGAAETPYRYAVDAFDPDGDTLSYALETATEVIPVNNHSFEAQVLGEDAFTIGTLTGWTLTGGAFAGAANPGTSQYPDGAVPDGKNMAYSNDPAISQVLSELLRPRTRYVLTVAVGHRLDNTLGRFQIELRAGGQVLALASTSASAPIPPKGTFRDVSVIFDSPSEHPMLGRLLEIRLSGSTGVNWDNVRFTATDIFAPPNGMTIDASTGVVSWTPTVDQLGTHEIRVRAADGRGGTATQAYRIRVEPDPANRAPIIISEPIPSVLILPVPANRSSLTIDFEGLPATPTFLRDSDVPPEARLSDRFLATHGVTFRSGNGVPSVAVVGLGVGHATSGSNGIGGMGAASIIKYDAPIVAEFFLPNDPSIPALTDFVSVKVDRQGALGTVVLEGFGVDGVLLESTSAIDNGFAVLTLSTPGIHTAVIRGTSSTGFDDFSFNEVYPPQLYEYDVRGIDPDGDSLTYSLVTAPFGMTINSRTGAIRWPVASLSVGTPLATVRVDDGRHGFDSQNIVITPTVTPAKISGTVFNDLDGDGVRNAGEPGLAGRIVYLDQSRNYRRDPRERFVITDANGHYAFDNLAPGDYTVREESSINSRLTSPMGGVYEVNLSDGQVVPIKDFGNIESQALNEAPNFLTTPPLTTVVGRDFRYDAAASDADPDPLLFDILLGPDGMIVDPGTGVVIWTAAADQVRAHDVILRVSDARGGVDLQSFTVKATSAQTAPVFITPPPQPSSVVHQSYAYRFHAQDAENDPLVFRLEQSVAGMSIDPISGLFTWTPEVGQLGDHFVTIIVNDGRDGQDSLTFQLEVVSVSPNERPVITSNPRTRTQLGGRYLYAVEVADANNDRLDLTLVKAPAGMVFDREKRLIQWFPSPDQLDDNEVEILANDGHGGTAVQAFVINVATTVSNASPQIVSSPTLTGTTEKAYAYNLRATESDGDPLVWSLNQAPRGMSIDALMGTIRWTPPTDQVGLADVEVLVTDSQGGTATQSFTVTVRGINVSPNISTVPPTRGSTRQIYNYAARASDVDGDSLSHSFLRAPAGMTINAATGLVQWTPSANQIGSHDVAILVEDGQGGTASQIYTVNVIAAPINHAPSITTIPTIIAVVDLAYSYDADARDVDGDSLTYELLVAPAGMSIDANSGVIRWTPSASQFGNHRVVLGVNDRASIAAQRFLIRVESTNRPPVINSMPEQSITPGLLYRYDVNASDPDGNELSYSLISPPSGMAIDALGRITWATSIADIGTRSVTVEVADPFGALARQTYDLTVSADTQAPPVIVDVSKSPADLRSEVTIFVSATDDVGVERLLLLVDGVPLPLDRDGVAFFRATSVGTFEVEATATDAAGNVGNVSRSLVVVDISDANAPDVDIKSPSDEAVITRPLDVIGTVNDDNLRFYTLQVAVLGSTSFTEIARGTAVVAGGVLGTLDPTMLENDTYVLRLAAVDTSGNSASVEQIIHVEGNLKLGNFTLSFTDLTVPVFGVPITVSRTYDTLNAGRSSDFGFGWRFEFRNMDLRTSVAPNALEEFGIYNPFKVGSRVYVTLPGGERQGFTFRPTVASGFRGGFLGIFEPRFVPDAGVKSSLTVNPSDLRIKSDGSVYDFTTGLPFNPKSQAFGGSYLLTTKEGIAYDIQGQTGQLTALSDPTNNILRFSDAGISGPEGKSIAFDRDPQGRITALIDPAGKRIRYQYDAHGDLVSVSNRTNDKTQFAYRTSPAHYLERVTDPLGRTGVRTEYDANGRLIKLLDASGNPFRFDYDQSSLVSNVTDALGNMTIQEYDARGNILTQINPLGGITRKTFDSDNNMLTETDELGRTTAFNYSDRGDALTQTDPLGNTTISTYQSFSYGTTNLAASRGEAAAPFSRVKTATDALGNTTGYEYDENRGELLSTTDQAGHVTKLDYDLFGKPPSVIEDPKGNKMLFDVSAGLLSRQVDSLGHATQFTYDANGNELISSKKQTKADGTVRTLTTSKSYDDQGRVVSITNAEGGVSRAEFDAAGNRVATIDPLGRRTELRYDDRNLLVETLFPDDTPAISTDNPRIRTEYDANGLVTARIDELSRRTEFQYDRAGQLVRTTYPDDTPADPLDNPFKRTEYDAAGQVSASIDERGNRTQFEYDAAGRMIVTRDALGRVTRTDYDAAGRRIAVTDALSNTTRFVIDGRGLQTEIQYADGTRTTTSFDNRGQAVAQTDQLNRTTRYEFDPVGRLTSLVDASNQRTKYRYDEIGNLVSQEDARGHVRRYEYDGLGRQTASVLPALAGNEPFRSIMQYDAVGNIVGTNDFNGDAIVYEYDARDRLIAKTLPDGTSSRFTYTLNGQRATATDSRGTTRFVYDQRDRLLLRTDPDGASIGYTYDVAGNRTSVTGTTSTVFATTYSFDVLNRESTLVGSDGITRFTYDAVGNHVRTQRPNGTTETRAYDVLNRLTFLENSNSSGTIDSYQYSLGPNGRRESVVEHTGRRVLYGYDALDRLTQEQIRDAVFSDRTIAYTYDEVGNRISRADSIEGTTIYSYDELDRLLSEFLAGTTTSYTYDNNGNTLSRIQNTDKVFYEWHFENRLIAADTDGNGSVDVRNSYDADGIRVSQIVAGKETRFLVDSVRPYAQVLLEYQPGGQIVAANNYGTAMISQTRGGATSFYFADGLGSTRALTNASGIVTDRYSYDAFGRLLSQTGTTVNSYLFAGQQRDSTLGMDYLRARFLNPETGRFASADPFSGLLGDPRTLHKYMYAAQNPVNLIDPSGYSFVDLSAVSSIIGTLRNIGSSVGKYQTFVNSVEGLVDFLFLLGFGIGVYGLAVSGDFKAGIAFLSHESKTGNIRKAEVRSFIDPSNADLLFNLQMDFKDKKFGYSVNVTNPKKSDVQFGLNLPIHKISNLGVDILKLELSIRIAFLPFGEKNELAFRLGIAGSFGPGGIWKLQIPLYSNSVMQPSKVNSSGSW